MQHAAPAKTCFAADSHGRDGLSQAGDLHGPTHERHVPLVTPDGRIAAAFDGLSPVKNIEHALAAVQRLAPAR